MNHFFRMVLVCIVALSVAGLSWGCSYNNLYKNYNTYHDEETPLPKSTVKVNRSR